MTEFDRQYQELVDKIMVNGFEEINERTQTFVKALPGETMEIHPEDGFPLLTLRRIPIKLFVAEQVWYLTGSRRPSELLTQYTQIWNEFTNPGGGLPTAYGFRWRQYFGRDQVDSLVKHLEEERSSRQAVVVTWDPATDGLSPLKKKNVPCPYSFTVNILGDQLHLHNIVRSNDMMLGCPHDAAGFALLQSILAARLNAKVGKYTHSISNAHVYGTHYEGAQELIRRTNDHKKVTFIAKPDYYERAKSGDIELIKEIVEQLEDQYQPSPPIRGMKVVG